MDIAFVFVLRLPSECTELNPSVVEPAELCAAPFPSRSTYTREETGPLSCNCCAVGDKPESSG